MRVPDQLGEFAGEHVALGRSRRRRVRQVEEHRFGRFRGPEGVGRLPAQRGVAALQFAQRGQDLVNLGEKSLARGAAEIERAGGDEVLQHAFVDGPDVDAQEEVGKIPERPAGLALADDLLRGGFAHALDAGETESDLAGGLGRTVRCRGHGVRRRRPTVAP